MAAADRDERPPYDFPVGDFEPEGPLDVIFDGHTGEGPRRGRSTRFFKTRGARVGPEGESNNSARWQQRAMQLDDEIDYTDAELDHAVQPVNPDDPWAEPDWLNDPDREPATDE